HLRVATALEVENSIGRPPVFVVTDETAIGVGRKSRLASPRKAEEERGVAGLADIRRAVHREHVLLWEQIIHHGEHRFLELAGVARSSNQNRALGKVEYDESAGPGAVSFRLRLEFGRVQHGEVWIERRQIRELWPDEHVS